MADTGFGMAPDVAARVFEPFFTTKPMDKGSGLGLTMVYSFITQAGGSIRVESEPGQGTAFTILLPAYRAETGDGTGAASAAAADDDRLSLPPARGEERLLIVDDEEDIRHLIDDFATALGYDVTTCGSGAEALALLEDGRKIDLLVSDIIMPGGMDGYRLAAEATAQRPELPVMFVSGYLGAAQSGAGDRFEGTVTLPKPFTQAELARAIRRSLDTAPLATPAG